MRDDSGDDHVENVGVSGTERLLADVEGPGAKGPSRAFVLAFDVEGKQGHGGENELHERGKEVVSIVNFAKSVFLLFFIVFFFVVVCHD